jgi:predicted regulator of Ras-like GTPase activity (Roadblock/LC7/MglB family)
MADSSSEFTEKKTYRNGLTIYSGQETALQNLVNDLEKRITPLMIMVADTAGQPILTTGGLNKKQQLALGSLVAGDLAASQETAKIIGQYGSYQMIIREGIESNFFISEIGQELLLLCLVPTRTPLGWSRLLIRETAKQLAEIIKTPSEDLENMNFGLDDENLADLYGDSLNNIWNG